jgi:hypothetical protein
MTFLYMAHIPFVLLFLLFTIVLVYVSRQGQRKP